MIVLAVIIHSFKSDQWLGAQRSAFSIHPCGDGVIRRCQRRGRENTSKKYRAHTVELKNIVAVHNLVHSSSYRPGSLHSTVAFTMGAVLRTSVIHRGSRAIISVPVPAEWPVIALRGVNLLPQDKGLQSSWKEYKPFTPLSNPAKTLACTLR